MSKKIIFIHPWRLNPPNAGNLRRSMEMFLALRDMGYDVTVAGDKESWLNDSSAQTALDEFKKKNGTEVRLYSRTLSQADCTKMGRLYRMYDVIGGQPSDKLLDKLIYNRYSKRKWMNAMVDEIAPDVIFGTYIHSDEFVDHAHIKSIRTIMDSIDLFTLNRRLWAAVESLLPMEPIRITDVSGELLEEDFIQRQNLSADPEEFRVFDQYDHTLAIVQQEADIISANTSKTKVTNIPMMQSTVPMDNSYQGDPFLPVGPNPYNIQGLLYFMKCVLPKVRAKQPSFRLRVGGNIAGKIIAEEGIDLIGFTSVKTEYATAAFMPCPVYTGTGQQVKISEAMAHGIPVVAIRAAAERSAVIHRENGLIANNAEEFADYVLELWQDRELCRKLGEAARETVRVHYSQDVLKNILSKTLA